MAFELRLADGLGEVCELNRLFLDYLRLLARERRSCFGLPRRVVRRLEEADNGMLDRIAALPTALFRLDLDRPWPCREPGLPACAHEQMRVSLTLTVLSSAWHMARGGSFEARLLLHLSEAGEQRLRMMPLAALPMLAYDPDLLGCAFTDRRLTWSALVRDDLSEATRTLTLIALQPEPGAAAVCRGQRPELRSLC
jgi:hypothetical protein